MLGEILGVSFISTLLILITAYKKSNKTKFRKVNPVEQKHFNTYYYNQPPRRKRKKKK